METILFTRCHSWHPSFLNRVMNNLTYMHLTILPIPFIVPPLTMPMSIFPWKLSSNSLVYYSYQWSPQISHCGFHLFPLQEVFFFIICSTQKRSYLMLKDFNEFWLQCYLMDYCLFLYYSVTLKWSNIQTHYVNFQLQTSEFNAKGIFNIFPSCMEGGNGI